MERRRTHCADTRIRDEGRPLYRVTTGKYNTQLAAVEIGNDYEQILSFCIVYSSPIDVVYDGTR